MAKKILLADDSVTIQKVVELTFSDGDYQVACVSDGSLVLDRARTMRPDIVLLDVILPGENGYDVCEALKGDPETASIPVLLLTGTFEHFDQRRADAVGADGHLTKPFESQVLVSRVADLLERRARTPIPDPVAPAELPEPPPAPHGPVGESEPTEKPPGPQPVAVAASAAAGSLSDDDVARIAQRVVERLGDAVVREVAWEVVPDLAEQLVRERIRQIEEEAD
ncbi:MAG: response regulator [Acidobacteriota bacterium]|jgi:CheY-like chemotaxis protein